MAKAKKLKKAQVNNSVFTGRLLNLIGTWILMILMIAIMAGAAAALVVVVGGVGKEGTEMGIMQFALIAVGAFLVLLGLAAAEIRFLKWDTKHTVISGNSTISVNYFQATAGVVLEAGSTINAANMNLYDKEVDSDFVVNGTVNACTLILVNDYYNTGSGSELFVAKDGVINGLTQNSNGRFDIQAGNMTVQGYVNGNWAAGGGTAYVGNSGLDAKLVVDGTYASEDSNNGKFVNAGTLSSAPLVLSKLSTARPSTGTAPLPTKVLSPSMPTATSSLAASSIPVSSTAAPTAKWSSSAT